MGNEYIIEPTIIPVLPIILNFNILDIIPLVPKKFINPSPCDIEGINIGSVKKTFSFQDYTKWASDCIWPDNYSLPISDASCNH